MKAEALFMCHLHDGGADVGCQDLCRAGSLTLDYHRFCWRFFFLFNSFMATRILITVFACRFLSFASSSWTDRLSDRHIFSPF
jgi:hypothetical protein